MGASRAKVITALLLGAGSAIAAEPPSLQQEPGEAATHLMGKQPMLRVPWQDLTLKDEDGFGGWRFRVTVDAQGRVAQAVLAAGPAEYRAQAETTVRGLRFRPFQRDGRAVTVQFEQWVTRRVEDYTGPADRSFPAAAGVKPQDVSIALQRTGCYGSCPAYRLELRGDGLVSYRGDAFVVAQGSYQWRVAPAVVAALVERFRQADYFRLKGAYIAGVTDLPSYITRLSLGTQQKVVVDYGGGDAVPDDDAGPPGPAMPRSVTELEDAIDAAAGSASWVLGDADTMARLRAAHYDFGSRGAAMGVATLMQNCQLDVAAEFVRAGKLASKEFAHVDAEPALWTAAACGDLARVRRLESRGALARAADARTLLEAGVTRGYPELVAMALKHGAKVQRTIPDGLPLIISAAAATRLHPRRSGGARYDPGEVIAQLLKAGADARVQYNQGSTALFAAGSPEAVAALLRAGLDPNTTDRDGHTALESVHSQAVAEALLAAGARLPTDPRRLDALKSKAVRLGWTELGPVLDRAAAGAKR